MERTRLVPPVATTSYNCRKKYLDEFCCGHCLRQLCGREISAQWWGWLQGETVGYLTKAFNHPLKRPLLSLQEGQRKKIIQIKESGSPHWSFWGFWVVFCLGFFPPKSSVSRNVFLLGNPTFFTTLNPGTDIFLSFQMASLRLTLCEMISFPSAEIILWLPEILRNPQVPESQQHHAQSCNILPADSCALLRQQLKYWSLKQQLTTVCVGQFTEVSNFFQKDHAKP